MMTRRLGWLLVLAMALLVRDAGAYSPAMLRLGARHLLGAQPTAEGLTTGDSRLGLPSFTSLCRKC